MAMLRKFQRMNGNQATVFGISRFRKNQVAIITDIESMFYQVRCAPKDRDYLRFLWWPKGDLNAEPVPFRMSVHLFGAKSYPSCAAYAFWETAERFQSIILAMSEYNQNRILCQ